MSTTTRGIIALSALSVTASASLGAVTTTITADNHYALYTGNPSEVRFIGANETGAGGAPGAYNWSLPETWTFDAGDFIYVAAWSDDAVAQGLLAEFTLDTGMRLSGDPMWEVFATGVDLDSGSPPPLAGDIANHVLFADANELWGAPYISDRNVASTAPWGKVPGITEDARWMWASMPDSGADPTRGGANWDEFLIFRTPVPAPGPLALYAGAGLIALKRRRR